MKYWKRVDIEGYEKIARDALLFSARCKTRRFWNSIELEGLIEAVPALKTAMATFGEIKAVTIIVIGSPLTALHIDNAFGVGLSVGARINIPVMNTAGTNTLFYQIGEQEHPVSVGGVFGTKVWPVHLLRTLTPVAAVSLTSPTILRTSAPHIVLSPKASQENPRISLTISMVDDVVSFLD